MTQNRLDQTTSMTQPFVSSPTLSVGEGEGAMTNSRDVTDADRVTFNFRSAVVVSPLMDNKNQTLCHEDFPKSGLVSSG